MQDIGNGDKRPPSEMLMRAQMEAEFLVAHAQNPNVAAQLAAAELVIERYRAALGGIASTATVCSGCQMLREVARRTLDGTI